MGSKRSNARQEKLPATPIDAIKRKIEEQERMIREQQQECEDIIRQAPDRRKEQERLAKEKAERERATVAGNLRGGGRPVLPDARHQGARMSVNAARPLRMERSRGRFLFFVLLTVLAGAMMWAYHSVTH